LIALRDARPIDAEGIARVQVAGWRHAYSGFMPADFIAARDLAVRTREWRERLAAPAPGTIGLLADKAGQVVGIASGGPPLGDETIMEGDIKGFSAQVYGLYIEPGLIGQGIGRRLLGNLAGRLARAGHANLVLWAFERNPFRRFYDRIGGRVIARGVWNVDQVSLNEIAYGWADIRVLIQACVQGVKTE